jgi:hypothetical protein
MGLGCDNQRGAVMLDQFSDRAKRAIFLARELASVRGGAAVIEPSHLVDALVREDQGECAARMPNVIGIAGQEELQPQHSFFSAETATVLLDKLEGALPLKTEPIPFVGRLASISFAGACSLCCIGTSQGVDE